MKKFSFLTKVRLCLPVFWVVLSSCATIKSARDDSKGKWLWSLAINLEDKSDGKLLERLSDLYALRLVDTEVVNSSATADEIVLLSPSYERLSTIRSGLLVLGGYRIKLSRAEK